MQRGNVYKVFQFVTRSHHSLTEISGAATKLVNVKSSLLTGAIMNNQTNNRMHDTVSDKNEKQLFRDDYSILIVDDAASVRATMQQQLDELLPINASVDVAADGAEALNLVMKKLNSNNPYSLILMDAVMPVIDGYRACKEIKNRVHTPVIMLTSNGSTWNGTKAKLAGSDDYLKKPVSDYDLQAVIIKYIPELDGLLNEVGSLSAANDR